jgi:WbqC-like protein family
MRVVMHQPCFIPWLGFFSKLAWADLYIVMDDAFFRKRYYHDRAQIIDMAGQRSWVSLPTGEHLGKKIADVPSPGKDPLIKISKTIEYSYARARAYRNEWPDVTSMLGSAANHSNLADINVSLIENLWTKNFAQASLRIERTSRMNLVGDATDKVIQACAACGATELLVGTGASLRTDVHDVGRLRAAGIRVLSQNFEGAELTYTQHRRQREGFLSKLSVVDALLNIGGAATYALCRDARLEPKEVTL